MLRLMNSKEELLGNPPHRRPDIYGHGDLVLCKSLALFHTKNSSGKMKVGAIDDKKG